MLNIHAIPGSTVSVAASTANARTALDGTNGLRSADVLSVLNLGPNIVHARLAQNTTEAATAADFPINVNERVYITKPKRPDNASDTQLNLVCGTGTATVLVSGVEKRQ